MTRRCGCRPKRSTDRCTPLADLGPGPGDARLEQSPGSTPPSTSFSATPTPRGNAAPTRSPTARCASTSPKAPTSPPSPRPSSTPSPTSSTTDHANASPSRHHRADRRATCRSNRQDPPTRGAAAQLLVAGCIAMRRRSPPDGLTERSVMRVAASAALHVSRVIHCCDGQRHHSGAPQQRWRGRRPRRARRADHDHPGRQARRFVTSDRRGHASG